MKYNITPKKGGVAFLLSCMLLLMLVQVAAPPAYSQDPWVARPTQILCKVDSCSSSAWDSLNTGAGPFTVVIANYGGSAGQILYVALEDSTGTTHQLRVVQGEPRLVLDNIRAAKIKTKGSAAFLKGIYCVKR